MNEQKPFEIKVLMKVARATKNSCTRNCASSDAVDFHSLDNALQAPNKINRMNCLRNIVELTNESKRECTRWIATAAPSAHLSAICVFVGIKDSVA